MLKNDFSCMVPENFTRLDAELALPKIVVLLGEIVSKAGDIQVYGPMGLSTIKYMLLHVLMHHTAKPTMTELQQQLLRSPANLTQLVDDLEDAGWIRRTASPSDRRVKLIELTKAGRAKIEEAEQRLASSMHELFGSYADEEVVGMMSNLIRFGNDIVTAAGIAENKKREES